MAFTGELAVIGSGMGQAWARRQRRGCHRRSFSI